MQHIVILLLLLAVGMGVTYFVANNTTNGMKSDAQTVKKFYLQ